MKNIIFRKAAAVAAAAMMSASVLPLTSFAAMNTSEFESGYTYPTEMRGLTAFQIASDMGAGWNLGNSLESDYNETYWGNPTTTKAMIDDIAEMGFTTLRVPVRWDDNYSNPSAYTIREDYMDRVETVVNYGLANDMYVILNVHHNDLQHNVPNTSAISAELSAIWKQVGNRFKNYGDKLIFEVNNEPRSGDDWTGNAEYYASVNECNEAARAAIRATGGNNTKRLVMLPTYCASGDYAKAAAWTKNANDDMIAASIHAYLPYDFAFEGEGHTDWRDSDHTELVNFFDRMNELFLEKEIPVVIGEFGTRYKHTDNTVARETQAGIYGDLARQFAQQDIPCVWWDNNCFYTNGENFGIYDRNQKKFIYEGIAEALISAYEGDPIYEGSTSGEILIASGGTQCEAWKQSVWFDAASIVSLPENAVIYCEYTSNSTPQLILQSLSNNAKNWIAIDPESCSGGVAQWKRSTLLSRFGGTFEDLTQGCIGATFDPLTASKVYVPKCTAHTHNYNGTEKVTLAATATTYGRKAISCSVNNCDAQKVVLIAPVSQQPEEPAKPVVTAAPAAGQVKLTWNAVNGATRYNVYSYLNGKYTLLATTTATSFTAGNLAGGTNYGFLVRAYVNGTWSAFTTADNVYAVPAATTRPVITVAAGGEQAKISWNAVNGATKYSEYSYVNGGYKLLGTTVNTSYTATGLTAGTKYGFLVRAYVNSAWSPFTTADNVYATPTAAVKPSLTLTAGNGKVAVRWNAISGATKYNLYLYNGGYKQVATTTATNYVVGGLTNGTKYGFLVRAYVNGAWTAFTTADNVYATPTTATKPVVTVTAGDDKATLTWNTISGATKYNVYSYVDGKYTLLATTAVTTYNALNLTSGANYGFLVRAYVNGTWTTFSSADNTYAVIL